MPLENYQAWYSRHHHHCFSATRIQPQPKTATPPIFSQMPNLKSINLRKNQIIRVETAVAGFKSLLKLQKVNLSYNHIKR